MAEKVLHVIIKILMYIFIVLLFILLFVRMSGVGRAIFADKPKDKNPQIASETVLVVEQGESLLEISKDLAEQGIVKNPYLFAISLRCMDGIRYRPGEYQVSSSEKPSEILKQLTHEEEKIQ